jgi:DNA-binding response OmpR family regulator
MRILIIEDDPTLAQNIREALVADDFFAENVYDGALAQKLLAKQEYACIIMDVNLPSIQDLICANNFEVTTNIHLLFF